MSTNNIRKHINLLESALHENEMSDALADLEREAEGNPTMDLAKEIADDYGVDVDKLLRLYGDSQERKANLVKSSPEAKRKREREEAEAQRKAERDAEEQELRTKINPEHTRAVEAFLPTIKTPAGFTREEGQGMMDAGGEVYGKGRNRGIMTEDEAWVKLTSDNISITINASYEEKQSWGDSPPGIMVTGHTNFATPTGWKTFSQRGIDDSFRFDNYERGRGNLDINKIVAEQIEKAKARIVDYSTRVEIPGLPGGFTMDPKHVPGITAKLQAGQSHNFMPGGMGTGYTISTRPLHRKMRGYDPSPQGPKELANFFGVPKIHITTFDAD